MPRPLPSPMPEFFNFATDVIDAWAADPKKVALVWVDAAGTRRIELTFAELSARSRALAAGLRGMGLKPGDRVKVVIGREPSWWITMIGLIRAGLVAVPGTTLLTSKDYVFRVAAAGIKAVIVDAAQAEKIDAVRGELAGVEAFVLAGGVDVMDGMDVMDNVGARAGWTPLRELMNGEAKFEASPTRVTDPCLLFFTSGTTGHPKMVLHTHASYPLGHYITGGNWLGLEPDDLHWNLSDTGWAKAAWSSLFGPWSQGAAVFVQQATPKFDAALTLKTLAENPITSFCAPPTAYRSLVAMDLKAAGAMRLRSAVAAGEPRNPEVIARWREATGMTIRDGYGQTETVLLVGNFPGERVKPGSMGRPAPGFEVEIIDQDLRPVGVDQEGEIAVRVKPRRPLGLFVEYENNPAENAAKFRGDYYLTGDRAYRDGEGYFWFVGRGDDVILSAGYRIGPFEVESALIEHPAVLEAAVVGAPDPERYEIVKAFVTLKPGWSGGDALAKELQDHVKKVTAPYKYPRRIEFVESLPKTISGKIRRVELREKETRA